MRTVRQRGLSLIELMVALVIGALAVLVINQVLALFEGQKRTSVGGSDAQVNGAVALFTMERDIRMAGYGLLANGISLCPLGVNVYYNGETKSDGGSLVPVSIIDGGAGSDTVVIARSDAEFGAFPTPIIKNMPTPSSEITGSGTGGQEQGQLFIVAGKAGDKICTLMQLSQDPQLTGNGWNLQHNPGGGHPYNPPNPADAFTDAPSYAIGDVVINMGSFRHRRYEALCDQLTEVDPIQVSGPYTCTNTTPLVAQIVNLQAQYGIVAAGTTTIGEWRNATGGWVSPAAADILRIRAIRLAVVARSPQYEKDIVSPATLALWPAGDPGDSTPVMALTDEQRHYRYKVFHTIVPLRNVIWGGA